MKVFVLILIGVVLGVLAFTLLCTPLTAPSPTPVVPKNHERVGPWVNTGAVKVRYSEIYWPVFTFSDGVSRRFAFCSGFAINGLEDGMVIDLHYREVNHYSTIEDPCVEWDGFRVVRETGK